MSERESPQRERGATTAVWPEGRGPGSQEERALSERESPQRESNPITARYLNAVADGRLPVEDLAKAVDAVDLSRTMYTTGHLSRPVFLTEGEQAQLTDDLARVHAALFDLPDRLFGGDVAAFARAVGARGQQVDAVLRSRGDRVPRLARGDLYADGTGFQLLELNISGALGGVSCAALNDAVLTHPGFADFAAENRLSHVDIMVEIAGMLRELAGNTGGRPVVALADELQSFRHLESLLWGRAVQFGTLGIDAVPCHLGQLSYRDGRVWVDGRPVDVVYRLFHLEHMLRPEVVELADPVLRAAERGEVAIFTPIGSELYGSKAALALLSDEANRSRYEAADLAAFDRILPWTRMVRPGPVTVDGERVELVEYARERREDLVLKATMLHSGDGFTGGWLVGPEEWDRRLTEAMDGPFVLQRRIRPVPELFPAADGTLRPWILTWGLFLSERGYAGGYVRGSEDTAVGVISFMTGAPASCVFHQTAGMGSTA